MKQYAHFLMTMKTLISIEEKINAFLDDTLQH